MSDLPNICISCGQQDGVHPGNPVSSILCAACAASEDSKIINALLEENTEVKVALKDAKITMEFYGKGENLMQGFEDWECPSGEVQILCDEEKHTVEDGGCARAFLKKHKDLLEGL